MEHCSLSTYLCNIFESVYIQFEFFVYSSLSLHANSRNPGNKTEDFEQLILDMKLDNVELMQSCLNMCSRDWNADAEVYVLFRKHSIYLSIICQ